MSYEVVEVFKEKLINVIEAYWERNPPKSPGAGMYYNHLMSYIESNDTISIVKLIEFLICAGYTERDVIKIFYHAGIITTSDDFVKYRDGIRRVLINSDCKDTVRVLRSEREI